MIEAINVSKLDMYIALLINAVFTGIGAAIGTAVTQWNIVRLSRLHKHITKKKK